MCVKLTPAIFKEEQRKNSVPCIFVGAELGKKKKWSNSNQYRNKTLHRRRFSKICFLLGNILYFNIQCVHDICYEINTSVMKKS